MTLPDLLAALRGDLVRQARRGWRILIWRLQGTAPASAVLATVKARYPR